MLGRPRWLLHFNIMSTTMTSGLRHGMGCYTFFEFPFLQNKITSAWLEAMKLSSQLLKNALFPVARLLITLTIERKHNHVLVNWSRKWQSGHPPFTEDQTESQKLGTRYPLESRWKRLSWYLRLNTHHSVSLSPTEVALSSAIWRKSFPLLQNHDSII